MPVNVISFRFPGLAGVRCAFQTRSLDPSSIPSSPLDGANISFAVKDDEDRVRENRAGLLEACGCRSFAELDQVHGDKIVFEPSPASLDKSLLEKADGMATSRKGLALLIKTADCQPLLVAHKSGSFVAAFHVGWRGDRILFPVSGIRRFCSRYGIDPKDCLAVRGPSLGPAKAEFVNFSKEWGAYFSSYFDEESKTVDLWAMTRDQLRFAGLPERSIFGVDLCTMTNNSLFYSYRADRACGRQASLIWIE